MRPATGLVPPTCIECSSEDEYARQSNARSGVRRARSSRQTAQAGRCPSVRRRQLGVEATKRSIRRPGIVSSLARTSWIGSLAAAGVAVTAIAGRATAMPASSAVHRLQALPGTGTLAQFQNASEQGVSSLSVVEIERPSNSERRRLTVDRQTEKTFNVDRDACTATRKTDIAGARCRRARPTTGIDTKPFTRQPDRESVVDWVAVAGACRHRIDAPTCTLIGCSVGMNGQHVHGSTVVDHDRSIDQRRDDCAPATANAGHFFLMTGLPSALTTDQLPPTPSPLVSVGALSCLKRYSG